MGVDFGRWILRFKAQVERNWFPLIPQAAMSMSGHTVLTFNVHKNGTITDLTIAKPSRIDGLQQRGVRRDGLVEPDDPAAAGVPGRQGVLHGHVLLQRIAAVTSLPFTLLGSRFSVRVQVRFWVRAGSVRAEYVNQQAWHCSSSVPFHRVRASPRCRALTRLRPRCDTASCVKPRRRRHPWARLPPGRARWRSPWRASIGAKSSTATRRRSTEGSTSAPTRSPPPTGAASRIT